MPAHRIVANLGDLPPQAVDNLKAALRASRKGKIVVVADDAAGLSDTIRVADNYRYLDVAVALHL